MNPTTGCKLLEIEKEADGGRSQALAVLSMNIVLCSFFFLWAHIRIHNEGFHAGPPVAYGFIVHNKFFCGCISNCRTQLQFRENHAKVLIKRNLISIPFKIPSTLHHHHRSYERSTVRFGIPCCLLLSTATVEEQRRDNDSFYLTPHVGCCPLLTAESIS